MMNKNNQTLKTTFAEAFNHYKNGNYSAAEMICLKILSIDRNHFNSRSLMATISAINKNYKQAKDFLHQALEIEPKNLGTIMNLGTAYKELGEFDESIKFYNKVLEIDPNHVNANYNIAVVFYKLGKATEAKKYLEKTVSIQSNYALAYYTLANVYSELREYNKAISSYKKAIEINPKSAPAYNNLGLLFRQLNDSKNAIISYEKAIEIKPNHSGAYHNLALTLKEQGEFKKAIKFHELAIKYEPENLAHYHFLSELKKDILNKNLRNKIEERLLNKEEPDGNLAYGNYVLAKYERQKKNYEKEFSFLIKGHHHFHKTRKKIFDLNIKYALEDLIQISNEVEVKKVSEKINNDLKPIFIVGVPRSGSTLVEKVVGSGENLIPMGEETSVLGNYISKKILEKKSLNLGSVKDTRDELYEIYKQKGLLSEKFDYKFTDKSLDNFFFLKLIKDIYPNAKVINCNRNPLSSIMSIFQNNLTELGWTHDLNNIFKYFDNHFNIIKKYKKTNPENFYDLEFENFLSDPIEQSKKLMDFCEIKWSKKCLEFYKRKDIVSKTTSNIQIREAIYKHDVKKYLPYKKLLDKYGEKYAWFK